MAERLIRIETGDVRISVTDLRALLSFYQSPNEQIEAMLAMARAARVPARWSMYREVASPEYIAFCGFEWHASVIRNFEPIAIPGLLQTEEYAEAVIRVFAPPQDVEALVDMRTQRQEIFSRDQRRPKFHFIIDESAIRRTVGSLGIMKRQLRHVMEMCDREDVSIRVVPLRLGIYAQMTTAYTLFEFPSPEDDDILWLENALSDMVIRENSTQERGGGTPVNYLNYFWELEQVAHVEDSPRHLEDAIQSLS